MIIYKTTNLINDKIYVGQTTIDDLKYYGSGTGLLLAIKKYGKKNFKREILEECSSINELNEQEIYWIDKLNATDKDVGYNISDGGLGGFITPEVYEKLKEIWQSDEWSETQSDLKKQMWEQENSPYRTKEYKESVSSGVKALWDNPDSVFSSQKFREKFFYERTEERNKEKSKQMKSYWDNLSDEERQERIRKSKEFWNSPEGKEIKSKAYYKGRNNNGTRRKK